MKDLTVVMYHYVRPIERSRYPGIKGLELNDFREQIAYLKKIITLLRLKRFMPASMKTINFLRMLPF